MSRRRPADAALDGVLLVDKPVGPTSHDLVGWSRRVLATRRVGHCGTLDPAASGLLVVAVGAGTRLVPLLTDADKVYRAAFVLGRSTSSGDVDGETLEVADVPPGALDAAEAALLAMVGPLDLPPPAFSAVKIDGERAHERARRGEVVDLPPRRMVVLQVSEVVPRLGPGPSLEARIAVSKGTYIRSLAEELGRRVGLPVHLGGLRRLACGELSVDEERVVHPTACPAESGRGWWIEVPGLAPADTGARVRGALIDLRDHHALARLLGLPIFRLAPGADAGRRLCMGQSIAAAEIASDPGEGSRVGLLAHDPAGAASHLILARVAADCGAGPGRRLAPERVLALAGGADEITPGA